MPNRYIETKKALFNGQLPVFKKGDRVWLVLSLDWYRIVECEVDEWLEADAVFAYRIVGEPRERPYSGIKAEVFPTRESLCEFYRKFFEQ